MTSLRDELGKKRPFESPEQEAYLNIVRTAAVLANGFERLFRPNGLSGAAYNILRILRGATMGPGAPGRRACSEIGSQMVTPVPDITRLLDRLESSGLVERSRCQEDRRIVYASITRKGTALLSRLDEATLALHRSQLGHMGAGELATLSDLMVRARHAGARPTHQSGTAAGRSRRARIEV